MKVLVIKFGFSLGTLLGGAMLAVVLAASISALPSMTDEVQDDATLMVSPAILEHSADAGSVSEKTFLIANSSNEPMPVQLSLNRIVTEDDLIDITHGQTFNATQWIELSERYHILEPGEFREISAKIRLPDDAEPGGHYATIYAETVSPLESSIGSMARIASRVGISVLITVSGEVRYNLSLPEAPATPWLQTSQRMPVELSIYNMGNVHTYASGSLLAESVITSTKYTIPLDPSLILPNRIRSSTLDWSNMPAFGLYRVSADVRFGSGGKHVFSPYSYVLIIRVVPLFALLAAIYPPYIFLRYRGRWHDAFRAFRQYNG